MMRTEYKVSADCLSSTVIDMEDIMGMKKDVREGRLDRLQQDSNRKQRYMNTLVMRMRVFLEPFDEEIVEDDARTIFDIMDRARARRATDA